MAMYLCPACDEFMDDDYFPMADDELCPDCHLQAEETKVARAAEIKAMHGDWLYQQRKDDRLTGD